MEAKVNSMVGTYTTGETQGVVEEESQQVACQLAYLTVTQAQ